MIFCERHGQSWRLFFYWAQHLAPEFEVGCRQESHYFLWGYNSNVTMVTLMLSVTNPLNRWHPMIKGWVWEWWGRSNKGFSSTEGRKPCRGSDYFIYSFDELKLSAMERTFRKYWFGSIISQLLLSFPRWVGTDLSNGKDSYQNQEYTLGNLLVCKFCTKTKF